MATTYSDLVVPVTKDQQMATLLAMSVLAELPTTSWQPDSVPRALLDVQAQAFAVFSSLIAAIAKGGILEDAEGDWLSILVRNNYAFTKKTAVFTRGTVVLTCASNAGPYTIAVNQLWATDGSNHRFNNVTGGVLAQGGTLSLTWQAEVGGGAYNVINNAITVLQTSLPGVTVNNPSSNWITQAGTDVETDVALRQRAKDRWPDLGSGATAAAYRLWALSQSSEVKRVLVLEDRNLGVTQGGHVTVYLAGDAGAVSSGAVATVNTYIQARRPLCVTVHVATGTNNPIPVTGTLYVHAGYGSTALATAQTNLAALEKEIDIAGTVYEDAITEVLMAVPGARNFAQTAPVGDTVQVIPLLAKFNATLTIVEVP